MKSELGHLKESRSLPGGRQEWAFGVEETVYAKACSGKVLDQASTTWGMAVRSGTGSLKRLHDLPKGPTVQ